MTPDVELRAGLDPGTPRLRRLVRRCGLLSLLGIALQLPLSCALAPFSPRGEEQPREAALLSGAVTGVPLVPAAAEAVGVDVVEGGSPLRGSALRALAFAGPLLLTTLAVILLLPALVRAGANVDRGTATTLMRFALAGAALRVFAYPVGTQDFWLSPAWGRMLLDGANPYIQNLTQASVAGSPISVLEQPMTYGPLWADISMMLSLLAGRHPLAEFLLFKLLLAGSFAAALILVRRIAALRSPGHEALAVAIFGWIPATGRLSIAEGHNDIVMVLLLTLWLYLLLVRRSAWSPLALTASVLVKYITAPLLAFELLHSWRQWKSRPTPYLAALVGGGLLAVLLFGPFLRHGNPLDATMSMRDWTLWTPALALSTAAEKAGLVLSHRLPEFLVAAVCVATFLFYFAGYWRERSTNALLAVLIAGLIGILSLALGHVWPWFLLWAAPLVALRWDCLPGKVMIAALLAAPVLESHWLLASGWSSAPDFGLAFYVAVALLTWVTARFLLPRSAMAAASLNELGYTTP